MQIVCKYDVFIYSGWAKTNILHEYKVNTNAFIFQKCILMLGAAMAQWRSPLLMVKGSCVRIPSGLLAVSGRASDHKCSGAPMTKTVSRYAQKIARSGIFTGCKDFKRTWVCYDVRLTFVNLGAALLQKLELKTCGQAIWGQPIFGHFGQPVQRVPSDWN